MKQSLTLFYSLLVINVSAQKEVADKIITDSLLKHYVQALAHDSMQGRKTGSEGHEKAASFIAKEMENIGLYSLTTDSNFYSYYPYKENINGINVIGLLPGENKERFIIFSAHFDHVGDEKNNNHLGQLKKNDADKIYNGANDNASGVAAMLAIAQYFKQYKNNYYSILFIAFSGEEDGLIGSSHFSNAINTTAIKQVVNLEMLGRLSYRKPFITEGSHSYGFTNKLNKNFRLFTKQKKKPFAKDTDTKEILFYRSDNYPFAQKGVPANTIMATSTHDIYYHSPEDEWHTLNYAEMSTTVKAIALACTPLVNNTK